ncbi:MAG: hypothetical protein U0165_17475 [Polyangiaceae bacterium]
MAVMDASVFSPPSMGGRWTLRGDCSSEQRVSSDLATLGSSLRAAFGKRLKLALVVGGFARGEGAMSLVEGSLVPHNDYDLLALVEPSLPGDTRRRIELENTWTRKLGVHVEIAFIDDSTLKHPPHTLFWLDVSLGGARVIAGDSSMLSELPQLRARQIPLDEAGRLLANRAVGLALSSLDGPEAIEAVKVRHLHKAVLACGDALLLSADRYTSSLEKRLEALMMLGDAPAVGAWLVDAYADAIAYRLDTTSWRPDRESTSVWFSRVKRLVAERHLAFEHWRVGAPVEVAAFVGHSSELFETRADARLDPRLAAARAFLAGAAPLFPFVGHPRERLARVAIGLAYDRDGTGRRSALNLLGLPHTAGDDAVRASLLRLRSVGS